MALAARALKTEEEISAVPLTQGVEIELPDGVVLPGAGDEPLPGEKKPAANNDDPVEALKTQLKASEDARKIDADRAVAAEKAATEARRAAADRDRELAEARGRVADSESDAVASGLTAAQSEEKAARAALKSAIETGDADGQADAAARIGRAASDIREFERAQATLAADKERAEKQPVQRTEAPVDPVAAIDANPNLMQAEKDWLKAHSDAVVDPRRNARLGVAYDDAMQKGLIRGTQPYFDHLNTFMGYTAAAATETRSNDVSDVQAPVTRGDRDASGRPSNNRITLTPEEREVARGMNISEIEYARNKVRLAEERKADPEKYR